MKQKKKYVGDIAKMKDTHKMTINADSIEYLDICAVSMKIQN